MTLSSDRSEQLAIDCVHGCLAGGALGDSLGLPYEGLSSQRGFKLLGEPFPNRLIWGYGLVSDDTEHACLTAIALIRSRYQVRQFRDELANCLKAWFVCLPPATGIATAKACLRLLLGVNPKHSGVQSAGNGPAMRAAVIGCSIQEVNLVHSLVDVSSRLTHQDQRASDGAFLVAMASNWCRFHHASDVKSFFDFIEQNAAVPTDKTFAQKFLLLRQSLESGQHTSNFATAIGMPSGVSGFVVPTVLVALHAWLSNLHSFADVIQTCIGCGGDTDTVASIAGSLSGAYLGFETLPSHFGKQIVDYPFAYSRLLPLARNLVDPESNRYARRWIGLRWCLMPLRNIILLLVVLMHSVRRIIPPY